MDLTFAETMLQRIESSFLPLKALRTSKILLDALSTLKQEIELLKLTLLDVEDHIDFDFDFDFPRPQGLRRPIFRSSLYAADDLLDEIFTEAATAPKKQLNKLRCFRLLHSSFHARKAQDIRQALCAEIENFKKLTVGRAHSCETESHVDASCIVGRDEDVKEVAKMLMSDDRGEGVSVIPITGVKGMGKTTLAQLLFNNDGIIAHFELRLWVHVGLQFSLPVIVQKILQLVTSEKQELTDEVEQWEILFRGKMLGKKYLLVLDDVSTIDREMWFTFMNLLSGGAPGSKIILTTRSQDLASTLGLYESYELQPLSNEYACLLFNRTAINSSGQGSEYIDDDILKKTGNVPLHIILGSLMYGHDRFMWNELQNIEVSLDQESEILKFLVGLQQQLRSSSRRCFAYCAIFPRDYEIDKRQLIQLWIAQGLVQPPLHDVSNQSFEDAAEDCFTELLNWSFFKDVNKDEQGNICSFRMNEFDLAHFASANDIEMIRTKEHELIISDHIHHVSVDGSSHLTELVISQLPEKLRSFINVSVSTVHLTRSHCAQLFSRLKHLRALDLHDTDIQDVPSTIGSLRKLRYLNLSYNPFKKLPDSLTRLINLQVLDLSHCTKLEKLPRHLRRLVSLRHLYISECKNLTGMPVGMGQMTSLQTLSHFVLGKGKGKGKDGCKLDELGCLNLKAELTIVFACQQ